MRRLVAIVVLLALSAGAAACTTSPAAATVDGTAIGKDTLNTQLTTIASSVDAQCVFAAEFAPTAPVHGAGTGTVSSAVAAAELDNLVLERLLGDYLARHHRALTAADVAAAHTDLAVDVNNSLVSDEQSGAVPPACASLSANPVTNLPSAYAADVSRFLALQEQFRALVGHVDISTAGVARYYQAHPSDFREACLQLVVADTQSAAQTIHAAIAGGQSFTVAASGSGANTQITPPGGQLACQLPTVITDTFGSGDSGLIYAASPGQLLAPMSWVDPRTGSTYWLVVRVSKSTQAPLSQVSSDIRQQLLSHTDTAAATALSSLVRRANVHVDPRYGRWTATTSGLRPPVPPPSRDVLDPAVNQALALSGG